MNRIKLWWRFTGRFLHKDFIHGVKNIIKWFPIIWKDRNWDHVYIYDIIAFKLKLQSECIGDNGGIYVGAERDAEIIMLCSKLAKKLSDEYYEDEPIKYHNIQEYYDKYPNTYKKVLKRFPNAGKAQYKYYIAEEIRNKAKRILFRTMECNMQQWWE